MTLKQTSLHAEHLLLKGRMVPFAGYDMPVQYSGVMPEHEAVRERVGLFDVSHMGEFLVEGQNARAFLNSMTTNDMTKLYDGRCQYNLLCYENGTVVDDIIVSQISAEKFLIVVNASNVEKDFRWLVEHKPSDVVIKNISDDFALIAVQGPKSAALLQKMFKTDFSELKYYHFVNSPHPLFTRGSIKNVGTPSYQEGVGGVMISRTGYTGEDGFEILLPNADAPALWRQLLEDGEEFGVLPAGLGARDTLRLEAAYSLYGHEINENITALEADLGWVVKFDKEAFVGKQALQHEKQKGSKRKIVGFEMLESAIAREGCDAYSLNGEHIGRVTSGTHAPTLKKAVGIALLQIDQAKIGQEILLDIRGKKKKAVVALKPFYKRQKT